MSEREVNGPTIKSFDPDDPECQRDMRRPPDIDQDMKEMERRKRVEMIMNSHIFREELERIIESQLNEGYLPASLSALQQVTELLLPHSARNTSLQRVGHSGMPINDIRGVDGFRYAKGEKLLRCKLAAVYRLVDLNGWSEGIYNHITARVSQDQEHFLINPFGLQYHEVTASSLLKVDLQGNVIDPGSTNFSFNRAGFVLHSAIHSARPDIRAIIHLHYPPCVAVSSMKCGLLPASQESVIIGDVSYYDYGGLLNEPKEKDSIGRTLGFNKVLILRNHGVVTCGESLEEALFLMHNLVIACETQIKLMSAGFENIQLMSEDAAEHVRAALKLGGFTTTQGRPDDSIVSATSDRDADQSRGEERLKRWKLWDLEFEAQMRMLDNSGYRTGYLYRQPLLRADQRTKYDVEVPPSASSLAHYLEEDKWLSPLKKLVEGKRTQDKLRWVNSPNVYQKVEVLETGTTDPKKITKWVQEGSPTHSTPIKIETPHQFVPVNVDPNEFKRKQKQMKETRIQNKITGGPQSHILEGVTWEEMRNMQDKSGDSVVLVGAASKGIIQREFQHNAMVYKSAYAKNPFDNVTDQELEEYKQYIEKKQRGEPVDDVPDNVKHLLIEPVKDTVQDIASPTSPTSPLSDEEGVKLQVNSKVSSEPLIIITPTPDALKSPSSGVQRSHSARLAAQAAEDNYFSRRFRSERKPNKNSTSDSAVNGEDKIGDLSGASRSSKESSPVKDIKSGKKEKEKKEKKKGIRTPSFLRKKKHKKDKEHSEKGKSET